MQTLRDKLKHPKALGARMASKQGVPGQDLSHRKTTLGEQGQVKHTEMQEGLEKQA